MDLLTQLQEKSNHIALLDEEEILQVVNHIAIAEKHYFNGRENDYLFTDAVYRTNQAFEGALKEAYRVISQKDPKKLTPYKIEKYFENNSLLKNRVLQLFTNYRTEWRNPSVHDHTLSFTEQEAFLAIVSISAFANILFDQIIEKLAYNSEVSYLNTSNSKPQINIEDDDLTKQLSKILLSFSPEHYKRGAALPRIHELELIGWLAAYITNIAENISVDTDVILNAAQHGKGYRPDLLISSNNDKVLVEIKMSYKQSNEIITMGTEQLKKYLTISGITNGILYIQSHTPTDMTTSEFFFSDKNGNYKIIQIYPKNFV
ncbi:MULTISPECIES: GxxExxY protein [unclassified Maridesulfovibrio]|uniref:GxxExxY protein n=1 Tax=unclassified Maridesulfovibrio TaxID=2794999 RepID=UPI003B3E8B57